MATSIGSRRAQRLLFKRFVNGIDIRRVRFQRAMRRLGRSPILQNKGYIQYVCAMSTDGRAAAGEGGDQFIPPSVEWLRRKQEYHDACRQVGFAD